LFDGFGVHLLSPENRDGTISEFIERARSYDVIVTLPLSDEFGPLATDRIRETFPDTPIVTIANIYFSGLHPDLTYIGGMARRVVGPIGDYHSKIALIAYLRGLSVNRAIALFGDATYKKLGYYNAWQTSMDELRSREETIDVTLSEDLEILLHRDHCFFSVNHPTSLVVSAYARKIALWLAQRGLVTMSDWNMGAFGLVNHLASSAIFPVYPEIARHFDLSYPGSYSFKAPTLGDDTIRIMTLAEMVQGEFLAFDTIDREELLASHQGVEIMVNLAHVDL
jgi:hypothetical protein